MEISINSKFRSINRKTLVQVIDFAKMGNDCTIDLIIYINLEVSYDGHPVGTKWAMNRSLFEKEFTDCITVVPSYTYGGILPL
ncbi:hypothetical protein PQC36_gp047 [Proteus phage Vb_PmiP-P59]|uniref:Uncharacterized protein n=1 Tax=Proteus phage Vb_PmiP-P59 TaxID=2754975 RepID=A0A7G5CG15_9CAUD|nr:hypothetical protein PQC36_gp047 [Proteus phage Vb_PmiP-P59]QMV48217.1 hypothetical protein [Proteus phage Vb_PmiP-P59]